MRFMLPPRFVALALTLLTVLACGREARVPTQVIVAVSSDASVAARLVRFEARISDPAVSADATPARVHTFVLTDEDGSHGTRVDLPFSFSVVRQKVAVFRLELVGFDSFDAAAEPVIERKAIVRFPASGAVMLSVLLSDACLDRAAACGDDGTCAPKATDGVETGECEPVGYAETSPVIAGRETFSDSREHGATDDPDADGGDVDDGADLDAAAASAVEGDGEGADAALADAESNAGDATQRPLDAAVDEASAPDSAAARLPPEPLPACPFEGVCPLENVYPCVPSDDAQGYECRGQYAAWPMPDPQPGGKTAPRYTDMPELGAVLDENTGLLWQREPPATYPGCSGNREGTRGDSCTLAEALDYCSQLQLASKRWRLPSRIELESLLDVTSNSIGATIDREHFPNTAADNHWSSSPSVLTVSPPDFGYLVNFGTGLALVVQKSNAARVRCVRSERTPNAPPSERFLRSGTGQTVRDRFTKLEWLLAFSEPLSVYDEAVAYCDHDGFRLPTWKEALTLANMVSETSAVFPELGGRTITAIWTTTPFPFRGKRVYVPTVAGTLDDMTAIQENVPITARCVK